MRHIFLPFLTGAIFLFCPSLCSAQDASMEARIQQVNQALDKAEYIQTHPSKSQHYTVTPQRDTFKISSEIYWAKFKEPANYSQKGFMAGYNVQYARRFSTDPNSIINMIGLQAQWAHGKMKQPASEGVSGIKDYTFDFRGIVGKDFYPRSFLRVTPYLGFGYRYLKDNSINLDQNIDGFIIPGQEGYSHYDYIPLGIDMMYQTEPMLSWEGNLEYDYVMHGWEVVKFGDGLTNNALVLPQEGGDGIRFSLKMNLYFKYFNAFAEGFYRYWGMSSSKSQPFPGDPSVIINEPRNHTTELGLRFGVQV